jgi:hypothetical protein
MQSDNNWRDYTASYKPLIDTGRKPIPLMKYPDNLDFSKTIGGTTYEVRSHFHKDTNESLLGIVLRWMDANHNFSI